MSIFSKKSTTREVPAKFNCADIYVLATTIVSNYNDGSGAGPRYVTYYFLATEKNGEYYELFSGTKLEKTSDIKPVYSYYFRTFDKPYIKKVYPLQDYLKDKNTKTIPIQELFDFITFKNVNNIIDTYIGSDGETE